MTATIFMELSIVILLALVVTAIMQLLKQPLIIGYILTGILVSPYYLDLIQASDAFTTFAQIGIVLLLFMVGLNLNPRTIQTVGKTSLVTGVGQILFTSGIGFFLGILMGFPTLTAAYIAVALTFSSTIIIMKLLSDKGDLETLYGKISVGFLIVQDLIVILALMFITATVAAGPGVTSYFFSTFLTGLGLLAILLLVSIYVLPIITNAIAKNQEFLLLFSLGWGLSLAAISHHFNFSIEIGALVAGVTLSMSPYRYEISAKMKPLRDFFLILFFISLGSQMVFVNISSYLLPIAIFSAFILVGNPLIVMALMGLLGYTKRNGFLAGLTVAQISEFSLILVALGARAGHVTSEILSLVAIIGLITIAGSTYLIIYANKIYPRLSKYLGVFERKGKKVDEHKHQGNDCPEIIIFGYNRIGYDIVESLKKTKKKFLVIDFDPETIKKLAKENVDCKYGDANDFELLNELNLSKVKMTVSTIPNADTNLLLIKKIRETNKKAIITVVSHQIDEVERLYEAGATYVLMPHFLGGHHMAVLIREYGLNPKKFLKEKAIHLEQLKKRKEKGRGHPRHGRG
jgi:Kef-type K+ transport system membrane component KefB/Trk K+ transport system NAD-binding subunit